jgi:ParB family chromosome partitioning protein
MWDILNFLKNPGGEAPKETSHPDSADTIKRRIDAQLEEAIEHPERESRNSTKNSAADARRQNEPPGRSPAYDEGDADIPAKQDDTAPEPLDSSEVKPKPDPQKEAETSPSVPEESAAVPSFGVSEGRLIDIDVTSVRPNPFQPRKELGEQEILELADSIKEFGVLQPILVKRLENGYELIAGERRLRAATRAGFASIPSIVVETEPLNQQIIALVENIQRKNLSSIEEASSLQDILSKTGWSQTELSRRMGRSQASIANKLRLLRLDPAVQRLVLSGKLGERQARSLLSLSSEEQRQLAQKAIDEDLSASALEAMTENWGEKPRPSRSKTNRGASDAPGGELLGDIAALVNRHRGLGTAAQWKVKQMNQSSLIVEITVDLLKSDADEIGGEN